MFVFDRAFAGPTFSDEWIEFWAQVYIANPEIRRRGILFGTFLFAPVRIIEMVDPSALVDERLPVMMVRDLRALESAGARCSNGVWVEKLRHRRHPVSNKYFRPAPDERRA